MSICHYNPYGIKGILLYFRITVNINKLIEMNVFTIIEYAKYAKLCLKRWPVSYDTGFAVPFGAKIISFHGKPHEVDSGWVSACWRNHGMHRLP